MMPQKDELAKKRESVYIYMYIYFHDSSYTKYETLYLHYIQSLSDMGSHLFSNNPTS